RELTGPVGELNLYALHPRGRILIVPQTEGGLHRQIAAALSTGNHIVVDAGFLSKSVLADLPAAVASRISWTSDWEKDGPFSGALVEGDRDRVLAVNQKIAHLPGPLLLVQAATTEELASDPEAYCLNWLLEEVSTSINTAAAGGNASLMAIG
ncbi:MAG: trifunctional transcriptional regulator/proline dehydrogenase/L-glutamate gamma-semialdehyde dehydrogenase, partial [Rhizobium sp.]